MIGDLSNAPEPIQIKLFSDDEAMLTQLGPTCRRRHRQDPWRCRRRERHREHHQRPRHQLPGRPHRRGRLGFTPTEVAEDATSILDGLPTTDPLIANGRPYTVRIRLGDDHRNSLDAIENTVFNSASGHTATLGSLATIQQLPPQNEIRRENLQRHRRRHRTPRRL